MLKRLLPALSLTLLGAGCNAKQQIFPVDADGAVSLDVDVVDVAPLTDLPETKSPPLGDASCAVPPCGGVEGMDSTADVIDGNNGQCSDFQVKIGIDQGSKVLVGANANLHAKLEPNNSAAVWNWYLAGKPKNNPSLIAMAQGAPDATLSNVYGQEIVVICARAVVGDCVQQGCTQIEFQFGVEVELRHYLGQDPPAVAGCKPAYDPTGMFLHILELPSAWSQIDSCAVPKELWYGPKDAWSAQPCVDWGEPGPAGDPKVERQSNDNTEWIGFLPKSGRRYAVAVDNLGCKGKSGLISFFSDGILAAGAEMNLNFKGHAPFAIIYESGNQNLNWFVHFCDKSPICGTASGADWFGCTAQCFLGMSLPLGIAADVTGCCAI